MRHFLSLAPSAASPFGRNSLSGRFVDEATNKAILDTFLSTEFGGGRHAGRVEKIMNLEEK